MPPAKPAIAIFRLLNQERKNHPQTVPTIENIGFLQNKLRLLS